MARLRFRLAWLVGWLLGGLTACSNSRERDASEHLGQVLSRQTVDSTWSRTDRMLDARFRHTATLMLDGKVLLAGGATKSEARSRDVSNEDGFPENIQLGTLPTASAELFDPVTSRFEPLPPMVHARFGHTATLLHDGRVLIVGGVTVRDQVLASAELYDPATQSFVETAAMPEARAMHSATLLADSRVLLLGGLNDVRPLFSLGQHRAPSIQDAVVKQAVAYQPEAGRFEELGDAPGASFWSAAMLFSDGRVVAGWAHNGGGPQSVVELSWFDPQNDQFESAGEVTASIFSQEFMLHYEAAAASGQPASINVVTKDQEVQKQVALDPTGGNETREPHQPKLFGLGGSTMSSAMAFEAGHGPLMIGGWLTDGATEATSAWARERADSDTHEPCSAGSDCVAYWYGASNLNGKRAWATATSLPSGSILVAGGLGSSPLYTVEQSSQPPQTTELPFLAEAAGEGHAATLLGDGRVLFTGGYEQPTTARAWQSSGGGGTVTSLGTILARRARHQSFLLDSGRVLLAGGETVPDSANEELFDPASGTSQDLGFRLQARNSGLALGGGRILFASDAGLQLVDTADFSVKTIDLGERLGCTTPGLARLLNGRVAVVGKSSLFELDLKQARVSASVSLPTPRCDAALSALPDGTLAIVGGTSKDDDEAAGTAFETYDPKTRSVKVTGQLAISAVAAQPVLRFSSLLLFGRESQARLSWSTGVEIRSSEHVSLAKHQTVTTLADGTLLVARHAVEPGDDAQVQQEVDTAERIEITPTDATDLDLSQKPLTVKPGQLVELTGLKLSKTWPENSGGTTQASATNQPVAMWIPVLDGWPVTGTFEKWSEGRPNWRVPHPAFSGLGVLGYALSGTFHPLRLANIAEQEQAGPCSNGSECTSGFCADGVCCNEACAGACEACTAALTGSGSDGICGPRPAGTRPAKTRDSTCIEEDRKTCGQNGLCDGGGRCALYPDGERCATDAVCADRVCKDARGPKCDGDHRLIDSKGQQTACKGNFRCSIANDECLTNCTTNIDCVNGFFCEASGACQDPMTLRRTSMGCSPGCRVADQRTSGSEFLCLGLGLVLATSRRRNRRSQGTTSRAAL